MPLIKKTARRHRLDISLVAAVAHVESGYRIDVTSRAGARGLMQVMPGTARHFRCGDLWNAADNLECGARVLKRYLAKYRGNMTYGLSAYNAGFRIPNRAFKKRRLPKNFKYVAKVLKVRTRLLRRGCF
jgi:soluble lytic murein transglycosylase-like protein